MDIQLKSEQDCVRTYHITVPAEVVTPLFEDAAREVKAKVALPGFRVGKVPLDLIKSRFRKEIRDEILERELPKWAREVDEKHQLKPVVEPYAGDIHFEEGQPFSCDLVFEVPPAVPPMPDLSTRIGVPKVEVPEDRVLSALDSLRERAATLRPLEEEARDGDYAEVSLQKKGQSKPFPLFRMASGSTGHPVDAALLGRKSGEAFPLRVEVPGDPKARTLAPGDYSVTVTRVARREVPAVDDGLAKHFGLQTLEELRAKIRADLEAEAQGRSRRIQEEKVVGALLERYPFAVPPTQVERQLRSDLEELAGSLAQRGVDVGRSLDWEKVAESRRSDSERQVRTYYLLQEVARGEGISVAEEEVEAYFAERAAAAGRPEVTPKTVREAYAKEGRLESVHHLLVHRKALDLLLSQASVTFEEGRPNQEEEIHAPDTVRGGADEPR